MTTTNITNFRKNAFDYVEQTIKYNQPINITTGGQDAFFLNGRPICSLQPGSEYTFTTYAKKNVLTIGRPTPEPSDETTVLKFIAGEKGRIEIHACAGRLLPGKFSNYTA